MEELIKEFFSNLKCSQCHNYFSKDSVKIMRQESNYTVVKVICPHCNKNIGLALLGLDREGMRKSMNTSDRKTETAY